MNSQGMLDISLLYVEDEQAARDEVAAILRRRVGTLFTARDGSEGLALFRAHHPDLVVTDIRMPVMDGLEMAATIRRESPEALLVVTSAHSDPQSLLAAIDIGVDQYVLKPVNVEKLTAAVGKCAAVIAARRVERRLRESEARLRAIFENSVDAIGITRAGIRVLVNPAYLKLFGYDRNEEIIGRSVLDIIAPGERPAINARIEQRLRGELLPTNYETRGLRKNGEEFDLEVHSSTYELAGEIYTLVIMRDISARKRVESQLRKLSRAVEQSPASIVITNTEAVIEYVNPSFCRLTGYTAAEAVGQNPRILQSGKTTPEEYAGLWATITAGREWRGVLCNKKKNGELYWEAAVIAPVKDESGLTSHYVAIKEDISERVRAQELSRKYALDLEQLLLVSRECTIASDLHDLYRTFVAVAGDILALDFSALLLLSGDRRGLTVVDSMGFPESLNGTFTLLEGEGLATLALRTKQAEVVSDFEREGRFLVPLLVRQKGIRSAIAVPMLMRDQVIGVLIGHTFELREFSAADISVYQHLANQAAVAISNVMNAEALRKSEKYVRDITSALGEGVYVMNVHGSITFMNPEAERLLGWSETELLGRNAHGLVHNRREDGRHLPLEECNMRQVIETGQSFHSTQEVFVRKDGTVFPISVLTTPLVEEGKIVASVTAFRDISERKQIEQEREQLIFDLQKAMAEIKTLHGIIPICASCKKIRDEEGAWHQMEAYISAHTDALFSHGICKECTKELYPEYYEAMTKGEKIP